MEGSLQPVVPEPGVVPARKWSIVWVVPVVALLLGAWLLYRNFATLGPVASIRFETAEEVYAGRTEVRCRSVKVGVVRDVKLAADLESVVVEAEFDKDAEELLRQGTRFWVVKPRVSGAEVSGLNTLIQGAYIEMDPGPSGGSPVVEFTGLETPPATGLSVPGRRIVLTAEEAGLLAPGSPVYHRGLEVGRVESRDLSKDGKGIDYAVFIRGKYASLVRANSRFWSTSGIDISAGADGFKVRTPSFQAMLSGGVSFAVPEGMEPGGQAGDGAAFPLYRDEDSAMGAGFRPTLRALLPFDQTVRGLGRRAPVEFRGIVVGRVLDVSFNLMPAGKDSRIPVLIEMDPSLMRSGGVEGEGDGVAFLEREVSKGLRGSLKVGSLLTGSLYVDLDYHPEAPSAELGRSEEWVVLPTVPAGLAQLEAKLTAVLDKLQALPLGKTVEGIGAAADEAKVTVAEARLALDEIRTAAAKAREVLEDPAFRALPGDLRKAVASLEAAVASLGPESAVQGDLLRSLDELRASLRSIKSLATSIDERPNSLLFGRESSGNPKPKAAR